MLDASLSGQSGQGGRYQTSRGPPILQRPSLLICYSIVRSVLVLAASSDPSVAVASMWLLIANDQVLPRKEGDGWVDMFRSDPCISINCPSAGRGRPGPTGVAPVPVPVPVGISRGDGRYETSGGSPSALTAGKACCGGPAGLNSRSGEHGQATWQLT